MAKTKEKSDAFEFALNVEQAVNKFCPVWFEIAQGRQRRYDPAELATQVSLLRVLNLRQALIKSQSWNSPINSAEEIRLRYASFVEQVRMMAQILKVSPPPLTTTVNRKTPALSATRILLQYDCSHWLDEQMVRAVGVIRKAARLNLFHDTYELFVHLRFELDKEWGQGKTEVLVQHEQQRHNDILDASMSTWAIVFTVLTIIIYTADVCSDILMSAHFIRNGNFAAAGFTLLWILWTAIVTCCGRQGNGVTESPVVSLLLGPVLPLVCFCRQLYLEWKIWRCQGTVFDRQLLMVKLFHLDQISTYMTYVEANNESLPQLFVQAQLLLGDSVQNGNGLLTKIMLGSSLLSVCWSYMINFRGMHSPTTFSYQGQGMLFVQDCPAFLALYIAVSLLFSVAPLWVSVSIWTARTALIMYIDGMISFREILGELSSLLGVLTFLERTVFYATHPSRPKKYGVLLGGFVELIGIVLAYGYAACTQREDFRSQPVLIAVVTLCISAVIRQMNLWFRITGEC